MKTVSRSCYPMSISVLLIRSFSDIWQDSQYSDILCPVLNKQWGDAIWDVALGSAHWYYILFALTHWYLPICGYIQTVSPTISHMSYSVLSLCIYYFLLIHVVVCRIIIFWSKLLFCVMSQMVNLCKICSKKVQSFSHYLQCVNCLWKYQIPTFIPNVWAWMLMMWHIQTYGTAHPVCKTYVYIIIMMMTIVFTLQWLKERLIAHIIFMKWTTKFSCHLKSMRDLTPLLVKLIRIFNFTLIAIISAMLSVTTSLKTLLWTNSQGLDLWTETYPCFILILRVFQNTMMN